MTDHLSAHRTRSNAPKRREVATGATNSPAPVPEYPTPHTGATAPRIGELAFTADGVIRRWTGEGWVKAGTWDTTLPLVTREPEPVTEPEAPVVDQSYTAEFYFSATAADWVEFWADQPEFHPYEDHIQRGQE